MASSSLTKMTIPLASDQSSSTQGLLMPKLKWRFRVMFEGFGVSSPRTELTKQVMDFKRPNPKFENIDIHVYNSIIKLAGKPSWADITCKLRDDANGNVAKLVGEQLQKQHDFHEQATASSGIDYKFTTRLEMLDGGNGVHTPVVLETWEIYGCYLGDVSYGEVAYQDSAVVETTLTIVFDNALQTPGGTGIGINIGRTLGDVATG